MDSAIHAHTPLAEGRILPRWTAVMAWTGTALTIAFMIAMATTFFVDGLPVLRNDTGGFITGREWFYRANTYGILPMIYGSAVVAGIGLLFSGALGIPAALFVSEFSPHKLRLPIKTMVELLAGVPSVVYGLLGVLILRQYVADYTPSLSGDGLFTAGLLIGVMVLPTVVSLSEDALRSVPKAWREASRGLGMTQSETVFRAVLPSALPGIVAALLLALGRAAGETIAVLLVVGRMDNQLPDNWLSPSAWLAPGQTITSKLGGPEPILAFGQGDHWAAICALAFVLMAGVAAITIGGRLLLSWFQRSSMTGGEA